jgi:hypothetical protein
MRNTLKKSEVIAVIVTLFLTACYNGTGGGGGVAVMPAVIITLLILMTGTGHRIQ